MRENGRSSLTTLQMRSVPCTQSEMALSVFIDRLAEIGRCLRSREQRGNIGILLGSASQLTVDGADIGQAIADEAQGLPGCSRAGLLISWATPAASCPIALRRSASTKRRSSTASFCRAIA